jgi:hypothetical protein
MDVQQTHPLSSRARSLFLRVGAGLRRSADRASAGRSRCIGRSVLLPDIGVRN